MLHGIAHIPPGEGRSLWVLGELVTCKTTSEQTGGTYSLFEVTMQPQGGRLPHVQHREDESFYVLKGEYEFLVEGHTTRAGAGSLLYVRKGILHAHNAMKVEAVDNQDAFTTETAGLPEASSPSLVRLYDGDSLDLRIHHVRKQIGEAEVRMLGYNGSIPGPTLRVDQGSEVTVNVTNDRDVETTVHWHGLRLENRYDGVPEETQALIPPGGTFAYKLRFPDPGLYWYHPHYREDFAQEMGLYGTIVVEPSDPSYWPAADRRLTFTLDDVLIEDGRIASFKRSGPTFTAMGRFGNVMLINGETEFEGEASVGEVVRFYLVNTANTRIFNFAVRGARMKLVGGDSGRHEHEAFVEEVLLSPSERAVVDVLFDRPGEARLEHRTPDRVYDLGSFSVWGTATGEAAGDAAASFEELRSDPELTAERQAIAPDLEREPDKVLSIVASMPLLYGGEERTASLYVCPMHPEVTSPEAGVCPKCGMRLVPSDVLPAAASEPHEGHAHAGHEHGDHGARDHGDGLEWEDLMPEINRASDPTNMIWKLIDRETGAENHRISWSFTVGERVKIRLVNEMDSDHPMHHPFHIHGAGRFLVLARDGEPEGNLVWSDTVLVRTGETVDLLLDVTNPGRWMAHCHIAEHIESGMMFSFQVSGSSDGEGP
jgi:FtsP/CotA-like multicopper oxidase with cupredoxin domain